MCFSVEESAPFRDQIETNPKIRSQENVDANRSSMAKKTLQIDVEKNYLFHFSAES